MLKNLGSLRGGWLPQGKDSSPREASCPKQIFMRQGEDLVDCFWNNFMCFYWENCLPLKGGKCFVSLRKYLNVCCWEHVGSREVGWVMVANEKKTWKFSRATLGFCQAEQVDKSDGWCLIEPGQPSLVNQGRFIKQKQNHGPLGQVIKVNLNKPTPMTTLVPFWIESNSSINFGLDNHLQ
jgi:hypothetical protein